ncbi:MAG: glycosyltransferase [Spirochaetales bacterium]|nr:glycosyltransferase [Spirochaetales bacterium]
MRDNSRIVQLEDYERYIGGEAVERIFGKVEKIKDLHVVNVSSTYYGGGVATLLSSLTILLNSVGLRTGWRVIQGAPDFFSITKKMHNALQGGTINLSRMKKQVYEEIIYENVVRNHIAAHDVVVIHDPQPLGMIGHYTHHSPWIWRCHVDMSNPDPELWEYLRPTIERYDAVVFSCEEYRQKLDTPQVIFMPAIDPFSITNRDLSEARINERLEHYDIPTDLPLVTQISRFDKWKDPEGVIRAFKKARKEVDATLVLLGNIATDDPEGEKVYHSLLDERDERVIILSVEDTALVNALQRKAAVVIQKSKREGFGLTVAEAMWKGNPVIGGNVGGIRYQIADGENGYLVSSVEETAERIVDLIKDEKRRRQMGERARETVREKFLLSRLLEQYLELFGSFETVFRLRM